MVESRGFHQPNHEAGGRATCFSMECAMDANHKCTGIAVKDGSGAVILTFSGNDNDTVTCPGGSPHKIAKSCQPSIGMAMPGSGAKESAPWARARELTADASAALALDNASHTPPGAHGDLSASPRPHK